MKVISLHIQGNYKCLERNKSSFDNFSARNTYAKYTGNLNNQFACIALVLKVKFLLDSLYVKGTGISPFIV